MTFTGLGWAAAAQQCPAYSLNTQNTRSHKSSLCWAAKLHCRGLNCRPHIFDLRSAAAASSTLCVRDIFKDFQAGTVTSTPLALTKTHTTLCSNTRAKTPLTQIQDSDPHLQHLKQRGQTVNEERRGSVDSVHTQTLLVCVCSCQLSLVSH